MSSIEVYKNAKEHLTKVKGEAEKLVDDLSILLTEVVTVIKQLEQEVLK